MVDEREFRDVMARFATGVTVITTVDAEGEPLGMTANAVTSVSLDPPLVLVCIDRDSASHDPVLEAGAFAVNVLGRDDEEVALRFAGRDRDLRFPGIRYERKVTGSPVLPDALGWLDCSVWKRVPAGDHTIVIGEVKECGEGEGSPLVFYRGSFRHPEW